MMHYYAQHTPTRDWDAPLLGIEELEKTRQAGLCITFGMFIWHEGGFDEWTREVGLVVGMALRKASRRPREGREMG